MWVAKIKSVFETDAGWSGILAEDKIRERGLAGIFLQTDKVRRKRREMMLDILIVEDHKEIAGLLMDFLRKEGYTVSVAETGEKALHLYETYGARLLVLDINLPGEIDGFGVLSMVRKTSNTHVLITSARTGKEDQLKGLRIGADDYIEKPYDIDILIAKIRGIMRRKFELDEIVCGDFRLNTVTGVLTVTGRTGMKTGSGEIKAGNGDGRERSIELTAKEYELLKLMMEHEGTTLKKDYLFNSVWGSDSESELQTLTVHIKWLREKLEKDPRKPVHIITVWGVGYRFEA